MNHKKMSSMNSTNSEENLILKFSLSQDEHKDKHLLKVKPEENERSKFFLKKLERGR